jgi:hypothetical protein
VTKEEISPAGKMFILKIVKLDPRNRAPAEQSEEDEWFTEN